jgi:hypothetical protein
MNERIKNFLVVCGMPNEQIMEILEDRAQAKYIQNFAELLIKECANQCTHDGPFTAEVVWGKQFREKILKHFGVE